MDTSDSSRDATPEPSDDEDSSNEDEDFQTVPMDDEHWTTDMVPVRTFCIHENGLPNDVSSYPCPYGTSGTASYIDSFRLERYLRFRGSLFSLPVMMKNCQD